MEEKNGIKVSLSTVFLILALIVIIVMAYYIYVEKTNTDKELSALETNAVEMQNTINELQEKIDSNSNTLTSREDNTIIETEQTPEKGPSEKPQIPEANTNLSEQEETIILECFKGVWISTTGANKSILAIDYGKRFACVNTADTSIEYGTYTVEEKSSEEPKIMLTYTSGKTVELKLSQAGCNYLISNDGKEQYVEYEGYYFGTDDYDEGIFNN